MDVNELLDEMVDSAFYYPSAVSQELYPGLGLFEEAGEVCGKFKKAMRDGGWVLE